MLNFLTIENFALIDRLEVEFRQGLTLITGETGSGKSILVDAVGLLTGQRAYQEMIRQGSERARVEGAFHLGSKHPARDLLASAGLENGDELIIRREIIQGGASKAIVNGSLVTLAFLAELGMRLGDIHGQHDQQVLLQPSTHLDFLDAFGENQAAVAEVQSLHAELQAVRSRLAAGRASEQERLQRIDNLKFQIDDIARLALTPGLDVELEKERTLLGTAEKRLHHAQESFQILYESEGSVLSQVSAVKRNLQALTTLDDALASAVARFEETCFQLEETSFQLRDYAAHVEYNPGRLEEIEGRLAEIQKARRKYGESVEEILNYAERIRTELQELSGSEEQLEELNRRETVLRDQYREAARLLSEKRREDKKGLSKIVEKELTGLSMQNTVFDVQMTTDEELVTEKGIDEVEFLISPNPGELPRPLAKIVSGGELSRVMLALKSILTLETYEKTLVFDEVDAGIGGRVASNVGQKLAALARHHQVFCVTHLPQIAVYSDHHFRVDKQAVGGRATVGIRLLKNQERVQELARMMTGDRVTQTTLKHAAELLQSVKSNAD